MKNKKTQDDAPDMLRALVPTEAFISKYKKPLAGVLAAVVALVGGYFLYRNFISVPREARAHELVFKGQQYFASDDYRKALDGDGQGFPGFLKIADDYGRTKAGNLARLYAGLSLARLGKYREAAARLEDFRDCGDAMVSPAAVGALGNCYAELGELDKATATLLEAARRAANNSLSPLYLIQAGEIFESQGKKDKALDCYMEIKDKYVNSMQYAEIDKYIERASE